MPAAAVRVSVLGSLAVAPLAFGAVHEPAFVPLLLLWGTAGLVALWHRRRARVSGESAPALPGARLLLAWHALVLLQLVPLPPPVLARVSPGSFRYYDHLSLLPLTEWRPISVNPADTARGLSFLVAMSLLYAAVFWEFDDERWRRRLCLVVVAAGAGLTVVALVQAASLHPTKIYGLWRPQWDWGVFGPYVSKNHFAGYMAMAIPLAFALAAEALQRLRHEWEHRRVGWLALGGSAGNAVIRWTALAMLLVVGLLASQSRGGLLAFGVSAAALPFAFRRRRSVAAMVVAVCVLAVAWVDLSGTWKAFQGRGLRSSRLDLWSDALPMVRSFPVFGSGLDTFGTAYTSFQTIAKYEWYGEVHNEYLQALLDTGLIGAGIVAGLLGILLQRSVRAARLGPLDAGRLASVLALCAHNLVDFNWQIPANAATFAALAAIAVRRGAAGPKGWKDIALTPRGRAPRIAEPRDAPRRGSGGGEVRRAGTK